MKHSTKCAGVLTITVAILLGNSATLTAEKSKQELGISTQTRIANAMDKFQADIRALDRQFADSFAQMRDQYIKQRKSLRSKLTKSLTAQQKKFTQEGELDSAVSLRDQVQQIQSGKIDIPDFSADADENGAYHSSDPILGTWRWNNGADIKNNTGGETNGRGTWKLVDAKQKTYVFTWERIPADRVRMSANGRVLEGTKAHDPTFRVWAVRID